MTISATQLYILIATALTVLVEHWFPFRRLKPVHPVMAYVAGVATVGAFLTLFWHVSGTIRIADFWLHFGVAGAADALAYLVDMAAAGKRHEETIEHIRETR